MAASTGGIGFVWSRLGRVAATVVVIVATAAVGLPLPADVGVETAEADTGSASCTEMDGPTRVTWRADYTTQTSFGGVVRVDALWRITPTGQTNADGETWQLRWDNLPEEWAPSTPPASVVPFHQLEGPLSTVSEWRSIFLSPRLVTPDGLCTIYLSPFANTQHPVSGPRIAVLGDDLVTQLNDSTYNQTYRQGYLEGDLNARGIRAEVEGQGPIVAGTSVPGRRWTPLGGTTGQDRADSHLLDEFRGLLEHDIDGFVMAAGIHDALWIAGAPGPTGGPDQQARRDAIHAQLTEVAAELTGRGGCVVVVTAPENESSLDPNAGDYAWAATEVNNFWRWVITAGGPTDAMELVDFGMEARGQPWLTADGVHLNATGITAYREMMRRAAERCADSVVLWGAPGTLDDGVWSGRTTTTTGQAVSTRAVPGWGFDPGRLPHFSTIADDGTIFFMNAGSAGNVFVSSGTGMTAATAFNPDTGFFQNIHAETDRGVAEPVMPSGEPAPGDIGDVDVLTGGDAVAFTGRQLYHGQSVDGCVTGVPCNQPQVQGEYPMFGVATQEEDGTWEIAEGPDGSDADDLPDWRNAWSTRELLEATVAADPEQGAEIFNGLCPVTTQDPNGNPVRTCSWIDEMAVLPDSGDVVLAHYGPRRLSVIDVGEPDANGRIQAHVTAWYQLPEVADGLGGTAREVQPDPTSQLGDERFGLSQDFAPGFIEFRYDATAPDPADRIVPVSAPVLSGQLSSSPSGDPPLRDFIDYGQFHYDQDGNLWLANSEGFQQGLGLKVYVNGPSGRKITQPECLELVNGQPRPIEDYRASAPGVRTEWGKVCEPDYNIRAQAILGPTWGIDGNDATGDIVITSWPHGRTMVIDPDDPTPGGEPLDMTFRVSNPVGLLAQGTTDQPVEGPCLADPTQRCTQGPRFPGAMQGQVDENGRVWVVSAQTSPGQPADDPQDPAPSGTIDRDHPEMMQRAFDQWVFSVDLGRLLGREPQRLTARPGQSTIIQGELHQTFGTTEVTPGTHATVDIDADAGVGRCWAPSACTDGAGLSTGGFAVGDEVDGGLPAGAVVEYEVTVPKDGEYQLVYRASSRRAEVGLSGNAQIRLRVDGGAPVDRTISSSSMSETTSSPVTLHLTPGTHTVELSAPGGTHGWQLDWMRFTRS